MREPGMPADETRRIAALHSLRILDTPPEERFDRITRIAQRLFEVPIALISLVDKNRQWFKSCQGLPVSETPRDISFCGHAILQDGTFVVPDAREDARFADNPLVSGEPHIRFYAGYPLTGQDGQKLGTLCIIDRRPRTFTEADLLALSDLAHLAERELNERNFAEVTTALLDSEKRLNLALESSGYAMWEWDITSGTVNLSGQWALMLGGKPEPTVTSIEALTELTHPDDREVVRQAIIAAVKSAVSVYRAVHRVRAKDGRWIWIQSVGKITEWDAAGRALCITGTHVDITARRKMDESLKRQREALRALNEIQTLSEHDPQEQFRQALALGAKHLQAEFAIVSHIEGDNYTIVAHSSPAGTLQNGQKFSLGKTYCSITLNANDVLTISHMQRSPYNRHPCYTAFGLESYIGAPVLVEGRPFGTVNFSSSAPREYDYDSTDIEFVRLLARWVGSVQERLLALRQLYSTMEMQRVLLDGTNYSIISTDPDGTIVSFNRAAEQMLGYAASDVVQKTSPGIFHDPAEVVAHAATLSQEFGETIEPGFEVFVAKARHGVAEEREWTYLHKDGRRIPVLLSVTALRDTQGAITGFMGIASDISVRKRAEEDLRRFKSTLDNTLDMIFMFDPESLRFVYLNRGAVDSMGYSRDELLEMAPYQIKPLMSESVFREFIAPLLSGEKHALNFETVHRRKDGTDIPVEIFLQLVRDPGERGLFVAMVRDITARKKIERMKNEFVSTVSHELRTPLTSIRGSLGLIAGGVAGEIPPQARELIGIAYKNSERLTRLINDILDIEKIESGKMKFDMKPVDLMALVGQALEANRGYATELGVSIQLVRELPGVQVFADPERLMQVMANLLSNAAKFTPNGSVVEISVGRESGKLRVSVSDRGPGIPRDFQSRVFDKFSQADSSDTRTRGGSGLGLSISKTIVEKHGGTIGFVTESGNGTVFFFELPEWRFSAVDAATKSPANNTTALRLLVCEDDPDIARLLTMMLEQNGFDVDVVYDAEQAKRQLLKRQYSAMTLDLALPGQDGVSFIRELRADPATRSLPIVVVSANAAEGRTKLNGGFAVVDWLGKPIEPSQLIASIERAVKSLGGRELRVLHIEDDVDVRRIVAMAGQDLAAFDEAATLAEARMKLALTSYHLVILDLVLPDGSGWDLLPVLRACDLPPPVLVFSAKDISADEARQVAATLVKSHTSNEELMKTVRALVRQNMAAETSGASSVGVERMSGQTPYVTQTGEMRRK